jgi:hypothetical protein
METLLQPTSNIMGDLTGPPGSTGWPYANCLNSAAVHGAYNPSFTFTSSQEENDGLVSRKGARGPNTNAPTPVSVPGTTPFVLGSGGYTSSGSSGTGTPNWSSMGYGQWYFIDYACEFCAALDAQGLT